MGFGMEVLNAVRFTLLLSSKGLIQHIAGSDTTVSGRCNTNTAFQNHPLRKTPLVIQNISKNPPCPPQHLVTLPNGHNPCTRTAPSGHRIPHSKYIGN